MKTQSGHEGKGYTITETEALGYDDVAATMSTTLEKLVKYVDIPPEAAAQGLPLLAVPGWSSFRGPFFCPFYRFS